MGRWANPLTEDPPEQGVLRSFTGPNESLMERLQRAYPAAHFVKAFNSVGSARVLDQFGWEAADMGGVLAARAIEPLAMLWCIPGFLQDSWTHAFKLLQ